MDDDEYDVVVVGAGAAGIGAGRVLRESGASYCILEAKTRIGGRAWTDTLTFDGIPFDVGCHWLHSASRNPLRKIADETGAEYDTGFSFERIRYLTGSAPREPACPAAGRTIEAGLAAIERTGNRGLDISAAEAVESAGFGPLYPTFAHILGLITSAAPERLSAMDYARADDTAEDYPVRDGLGDLVCRLGRDLAVRIGTRVTAVDHSGRNLRIATDAGTVRAKALILTVSTTVLSSGSVRMTPPLPADICEALAACPLGVCEKVTFLMDRPVQGFPDNSYLTLIDDHAPVSFYLNPFGRPIVVVDLAGAYLADVAKAGSTALIELAAQAVGTALGTDARREIAKAATSQWTTDPDIRGAYSHALPGRASARQTIAQPVEDRIFIAGEAASTAAFASCHGAYESGVAAAKKALARSRSPVFPTRNGQ